MNNKSLYELLKKIREKEVSIDQAVESLRHLPFEDISFARLDHHRQLRCGFAEVIYCEGKATEHILEIFGKLAEKGHNVLATRAKKRIYKALMATGRFADARYDRLGRTILLEQTEFQNSDDYIAVVTAGTADMPVAMEAMVTCRAMGQEAKLICDVGVAGIHRLLGHSETRAKWQKANAVIVAAGMEGALASVVGGLVECPVIAVPTSVGYGASFNGLAALLAMLNSCASGVTVVNIDNGFGAGYSASIINAKIKQRTEG